MPRVNVNALTKGINKVAQVNNFQFKNGNSKPLLLWCSSHETLAKEEIPLLLEAGFRVIPLLTNMWTMKYDESLDETLCQEWKKTVALDDDIVREIQACRIFETSPNLALTDREVKLLEKHVDIFYVTIWPNIAGHLCHQFNSSVIFRPFGHGDIQTYSNVCKLYGSDLNQFVARRNYIWCPILRTLLEPEQPEICQNPVFLRAFVTPARLQQTRWMADQSEPVVIDTIPRIQNPYYMAIYKRYINDFASLPLKILGGNEPGGGGDLNDPRIIGRLPDEEYHRLISTARVCIYHGQSRYHLHYHPIEFMFIGLPVLFHKDTPIAVELLSNGIDEAEACFFGMYSSIDEASSLAQRMLENPSIACELSARQSIFREKIFCRDKALDDARWLKTVCQSQLRWIAENKVVFDPIKKVSKQEINKVAANELQAPPNRQTKVKPTSQNVEFFVKIKKICKKVIKKMLFIN